MEGNENWNVQFQFRAGMLVECNHPRASRDAQLTNFSASSQSEGDSIALESIFRIRLQDNIGCWVVRVCVLQGKCPPKPSNVRNPQINPRMMSHKSRRCSKSSHWRKLFMFPKANAEALNGHKGMSSWRMAEGLGVRGKNQEWNLCIWEGIIFSIV